MKPASQAFRSTQERAPRLYDGSVCTLGSVRMKFVNDILCYFRPDERLKHKRRKQRKNSTKPGLYRFFLFLIQRSMEWRWRWLKISYCQNALKEEQMKAKRTHARTTKQAKQKTKKTGVASPSDFTKPFLVGRLARYLPFVPALDMGSKIPL